MDDVDHDQPTGPEGDVADCREAVERLYHYLDGELTYERRLVIQRHLDSCHDCIEAYEFEAELRIAISRSCREQVPPTLVARVAAALEMESEPPG
jgi:mycothiol system anti-sigma-R factor